MNKTCSLSSKCLLYNGLNKHISKLLKYNALLNIYVINTVGEHKRRKNNEMHMGDMGKTYCDQLQYHGEFSGSNFN